MANTAEPVLLYQVNNQAIAFCSFINSIICYLQNNPFYPKRDYRIRDLALKSVFFTRLDSHNGRILCIYGIHFHLSIIAGPSLGIEIHKFVGDNNKLALSSSLQTYALY